MFLGIATHWGIFDMYSGTTKGSSMIQLPAGRIWNKCRDRGKEISLYQRWFGLINSWTRTETSKCQRLLLKLIGGNGGNMVERCGMIFRKSVSPSQGRKNRPALNKVDLWSWEMWGWYLRSGSERLQLEHGKPESPIVNGRMASHQWLVKLEIN